MNEHLLNFNQILFKELKIIKMQEYKKIKIKWLKCKTNQNNIL